MNNFGIYVKPIKRYVIEGSSYTPCLAKLFTIAGDHNGWEFLRYTATESVGVINVCAITRNPGTSGIVFSVSTQDRTAGM